jgi:hypothetical protein
MHLGLSTVGESVSLSVVHVYRKENERQQSLSFIVSNGARLTELATHDA